ncbi:hypothetical protein NY486_15790, partial [Enterobacter hormaechei]|nr:hypothetical protein [Enterobacter hormaechei]
CRNVEGAKGAAIAVENGMNLHEYSPMAAAIRQNVAGRSACGNAQSAQWFQNFLPCSGEMRAG